MIFFWFLLTAGVVVYLQSILFRRHALKGLRYSRKFQKNACVCGEEIELIEQLSNEKWLPVPWLRAESQLSAYLKFRGSDNFAVSSGQHYQNHRSLFSMAPYTKLTRTHRLTPTRRGWYRLNSITMTAGDLLGGMGVSLQVPLQGELLVYPKPADVPVHELPHHSWQGETQVRRFIVPDPFVVAGARAYQPGDSYRQVNWKATARTGALQVHQYDYTANRSLMIYLNVEDGEGMWRSVTNEAVIELGIEWAAGAALAVIGEGMEVGFTANMAVEGELDSVREQPRSGHEQLYRLNELMAKLKLERSEPFVSLLGRESAIGYNGIDALIISAYWNDELEREAELLRRHGNAVTVWQLPSAKELTAASSDRGLGA
ncbi:DUF58 domain-containing protein [Paenibacillus sp. LHD-117]|uniref:DUF58 domain-containing protein n=1 Tax=Paenibacillus sp. LHD-117 TaxID=3071412 RepID=UPI0027E1A863|nr:DUF58 domain-containing protein [Paenibacillus sp. LHD-117]MDQ6418051.1 DUF58 domain-containing protein [Paenibacillus sp. LHD-117]